MSGIISVFSCFKFRSDVYQKHFKLAAYDGGCLAFLGKGITFFLLSININVFTTGARRSPYV